MKCYYEGFTDESVSSTLNEAHRPCPRALSLRSLIKRSETMSISIHSSLFCALILRLNAIRGTF